MTTHIRVAIWLVSFVFPALLSAQAYWVRSYGGSLQDAAHALALDPTGAVIVVGSTRSINGDFVRTIRGRDEDSQIFIMKLDRFGKQLWKKTLGGLGDDEATAVAVAADGTIIVAGTSNSTDGDFLNLNKGAEDIAIVKYDQNGNLLWKKTYGGESSDWCTAIASTPDGGVVLTGGTSSNDGDFTNLARGKDDIVVMKVSKDGLVQWKRVIGGSNNEVGASIAYANDGSAVITGYTVSLDADFKGLSLGSEDIVVVKLASGGNIDWIKTFGGGQRDEGLGICATKDGGYAVTGWTSSGTGTFASLNNIFDYDIFFLKLDSKGTIVYKNCYGGTNEERGTTIRNTHDGGFAIAGWSWSNNRDFARLKRGNADASIIRTDEYGNATWIKNYCGSEWDECYGMELSSQHGYIICGKSPSDDHDLLGMNKGFDDAFVMSLDSNGAISTSTSVHGSFTDNVTMNVAPNPVTSSAVISFMNQIPTVVRVEVIDAIGRVVDVALDEWRDVGMIQVSINTKAIASGTYMIRATCGEDRYTTTLHVMR